MTTERWTVVGILSGTVLALVGLGFAAMAVNPSYDIPHWVPCSFFALAGIVLLALIIYLLFPKIKQIRLKQGKGRKMIVVFGGLLMVGGLIVMLSQLNFKSEVKTQANVQPPNTPTVSTPIKPTSLRELPTFVDGNQEVTVRLGMMNMKARVSELINTPHDFKVDAYKILSFYVANHALYVDTTLYGGDQLSQVQLKQNILVSVPPNWDYNSDGSTIEIVNDKQEPIFQLIYKTQYYIVINGYLYYPGGFMFVNEDGRAIMNPKTPPIDYSFKRIFQYPSLQFQGQRMEP